MALEREVPYCTIFLVAGTIACHLLVLMGNLSEAGMLHNFGKSTSGWATVGESLSSAMKNELEPDIDKVSSFLSDSIVLVAKIESGMDIVLSTSGSTVDAALANFTDLNMSTLSNITKGELDEFQSRLTQTMHTYIEKLLGQVNVLIQRFLDAIMPALNKAREWLASFGDKIQAALEEFGTTIDRVQKLFDQVMAKLSPSAGANEDVMLQNTYVLMDTDNDHDVDAGDLRSVAKLYGISAFAGSKADELFNKYDADGHGGLDESEYALLVQDPSIPGLMTVMLRTYARQLSTVAGRVAGARKRGEVARAVVDYVGLVCAKNLTKVGWIAQALSNGSLPLPLTADILQALASDADSPERLSRVDLGGLLAGELLKANTSHTLEALRLMSDPSFWDAEGFDAQEQPVAVEHIVRWLVQAPGGAHALRRTLRSELDDPGAAEEKLPQAAFRITTDRSNDYLARKRSGKAKGDSSLYASTASRRMRDSLLGGVGAAAAGENPDAEATVRQGVPALPVTLKFASWLAHNATTVADGFQHDCFEYSGESSGALESFANEVNGMVKKVQSFLNLLSKYATEAGFDQLVSEARGFASEATKDIGIIVEDYVDERLHLVECKLNLTNCSVKEEKKDMPMVLSGAFTFLTTTLQELKSALPMVISNLKFAKSEVAKVHAGMASVMKVLKGRAPPMFYQISNLYQTLWITYFVLFALLTVGILLYAFWASGWMGGPQGVAGDDNFQPPRTMADRVRVCCKGCNACLRGCHDNALCFWSVLLLMELIVMVIFAVAVVICIVGGLQAFMSAGCSQIYVISDNTICTVALKTIKTFQKTFWQSEIDIDDACRGETLLTCRLIAEEMVSAVKLSMIGGIVASVLSLQLLLDSAVKHEQATFRRMLNAETKQSKQV